MRILFCSWMEIVYISLTGMKRPEPRMKDALQKYMIILSKCELDSLPAGKQTSER